MLHPNFPYRASDHTPTAKDQDPGGFDGRVLAQRRNALSKKDTTGLPADCLASKRFTFRTEKRRHCGPEESRPIRGNGRATWLHALEGPKQGNMDVFAPAMTLRPCGGCQRRMQPCSRRDNFRLVHRIYQKHYPLRHFHTPALSKATPARHIHIPRVSGEFTSYTNPHPSVRRNPHEFAFYQGRM